MRETLSDLPDLNVGDTVHIVTIGNYGPDRTLTVEADEEEHLPKSLGFNRDGEGYTLSGYGTTYSLTVSNILGGDESRVDLVWDSKPSGSPVESIEVTERA